MNDEARKDPEDIASATLLGDLMSLVLQELKAAPDVWQKLSQSQQDDVIHRVEASLRQSATKAVKIIASEDHPTITGSLEQVTVKDGYKLVVKVAKGNALAHHLIDCQGSTIALVITGVDGFMGGADAVKSEPDQHALPIEEEEEEEEDE